MEFGIEKNVMFIMKEKRNDGRNIPNQSGKFQNTLTKRKLSIPGNIRSR